MPARRAAELARPVNVKLTRGTADPGLMPHPSERRVQKRIPCRHPISLSGSTKPVSGTMRDVSAGGLSVQVPVSVEQGEVVRVEIQPPGGSPIVVQAIVWHSRRVRKRQTREQSFVVGMLLSSAPDEYAKLLEDKRLATVRPDASPKAGRKAKEGPGKEAAPQRSQAKEAPGKEAAPERYRVRIQLTGSSRTRSVVVFASSLADARRTAIAEAGEDWRVLDATHD